MKGFALLTAAIFSVLLLSACGENGRKDTTTSGTQATQPSTTGNDTTPDNSANTSSGTNDNSTTGNTSGSTSGSSSY